MSKKGFGFFPPPYTENIAWFCWPLLEHSATKILNTFLKNVEDLYSYHKCCKDPWLGLWREMISLGNFLSPAMLYWGYMRFWDSAGLCLMLCSLSPGLSCHSFLSQFLLVPDSFSSQIQLWLLFFFPTSIHKRNQFLLSGVLVPSSVQAGPHLRRRPHFCLTSNFLAESQTPDADKLC